VFYFISPDISLIDCFLEAAFRCLGSSYQSESRILYLYSFLLLNFFIEIDLPVIELPPLKRIPRVVSLHKKSPDQQEKNVLSFKVRKLMMILIKYQKIMKMIYGIIMMTNC